ncbi:MAG: virulence protein SciE type [Rhizobacter sp.]|nr:virulence protein SciE type [Rhizobacter sp.]
MTPVQSAEQSLREGNVDAALKSLQDGVRAQPADAKLRIFLFQLLCVMGQWPRALTQLEVCGELDASTIPMVSTYREALKCETLRVAVFAGKNTPMVFGQPQAWVALLIEALRCDARDDPASAARLRDEAFEAAPATPGNFDGTEFDWIADADSRLGPVLEAVINGRYCWVPFGALAKVVIEAPVDLRDLVWCAAQLEFSNGGSSVALVPTRYPGSAEAADSAVRLARRTDWLELGGTHFRGLGQRVLTTSAADVDLLQVREISLQPAPQAGAAPGESGAA